MPLKCNCEEERTDLSTAFEIHTGRMDQSPKTVILYHQRCDEVYQEADEKQHLFFKDLVDRASKGPLAFLRKKSENRSVAAFTYINYNQHNAGFCYWLPSLWVHAKKPASAQCSGMQHRGRCVMLTDVQVLIESGSTATYLGIDLPFWTDVSLR